LASLAPVRAGACPDWEALAAYVEDRPGGRSGGWLDDHLTGCESCLLQVAMFRLARESELAALPVLAAVVPVRRETPARTVGFWSRWWVLGPAVALTALGILTIVPRHRLSNPAVARSRPAVDGSAHGSQSQSLPTLSTPSGPARPTEPGPVAALSGPPDAPGLSPTEAPTLYRGLDQPLSRDLPGPVTILFRYLSGNVPHEVPFQSTQALALHSGDRFSLRVSTRSAMWIYVFQEDAHNAVSALFPSAQFRTGANPVDAANGRVIPSSSREFELDETTGVERIYLFYGAAPVDRCERLLALVDARSVDSDVRRILRELVRTADASDAGYRAVRFSFRHEP
jgi:hypothetical protein